MKVKKDYSRLVAIDLSPSEAAILFGFIRAALELMPKNPESYSLRDTIEGIARDLFKQLHGLDWPMDDGIDLVSPKKEPTE